MFGMRSGLFAVVLVSAACFASVAATREGKPPPGKLLDVKAEISKVAAATTSKST